MTGYEISEAGASGIKKSTSPPPLSSPHWQSTAIDAATTNPKTQIPGFVFCAVNKNGEEIFSHASGRRGVDTDEPMTLDSIFWIASCTKMIAGIACMQLVEQGKLSLDDADLAERLCPELKLAKILKGFDSQNKPILEQKTKRITLRMLLSHTAQTLDLQTWLIVKRERNLISSLEHSTEKFETKIRTIRITAMNMARSSSVSGVPPHIFYKESGPWSSKRISRPLQNSDLSPGHVVVRQWQRWQEQIRF